MSFSDTAMEIRTRHALYVQCNTVTRSRNHCSSGNATMSSVCLVKLHVTVNSLKILSVAQKSFYGDSISPAKIKGAYVVM